MDNANYNVPSYGRPETTRVVESMADKLKICNEVCTQTAMDMSELRKKAVETAASRSSLQKLTHFLVAGVRPDEKSFLDRESEIGGKLFHKSPETASQRFWTHGGEWFLEKTARGQKASDVYRYQPGPNGITTLVNGELRYSQPEELEKVAVASQLHYKDIKELYVKENLI